MTDRVLLFPIYATLEADIHGSVSIIMTDFNTSLLREKFVITEDGADQEAFIALSNRLILPLHASNGRVVESFVIRAQTMHLCTRFAALIVREFQDNGSLLSRRLAFNWEKAWQSVTKGYEAQWNPQRWATVYHKGRVVFAGGPALYHPFLDVIEQCDARNKDAYDKSLPIAENAFSQAGKSVSIMHDSNVALILGIAPEEGRCGVILRGSQRTTTFNLIIRPPSAGKEVTISPCLSVCAAFLEGVQLAFLVGRLREKERYGLAEPEEIKQVGDASRKLGRLKAAIGQFENMFRVTYRPEAPEFPELIEEAATAARKTLAEQAIETGEWVA